MTSGQREKIRKLQNKLCSKAVEYKGVKEQACAECESPCRFGGELLDVLGMAKPQARAAVYDATVAGLAHSVRRIVRSINRRWK